VRVNPYLTFNGDCREALQFHADTPRPAPRFGMLTGKFGIPWMLN
jgi:uncharacterized glyoxalase superfamily protein PhnB